MSRRKNKIIASNDGWSNVIGKGRSPLRKPSELDKLANCSSHDSSRPIIDYDEWFPGATRNLAEKVAELGASKLWEEIKVEVKKFGHEARRIKNVVVLGLGSLQGNTKESSFWQLALALEMSRLLHGKDGYSLYIQDPAFTETDIKFFSKGQKATVLQHPEAEAHITEETFFFAPHLEYEILQESLKYHPAVVFCNDLQNFMDTKFMGLKDYPEFVYYLENFNSFVLGGVDSHDDIGGGRAFNHSALYWRSTSSLSIGTSIEVVEQVSGDNDEKVKRKEKKGKKDIDYIIENIKDVLI